jgi:hypothetical protein
MALRARLAQQQQVVAAHAAHDARLAALLRSMAYAGRGGGGMRWGGAGFGGAIPGGRGGAPWSLPLSGPSGRAGVGRTPRTAPATRGAAPVSNAAGIDLRDIRYDKTGAPRGRAAAERYVNAALDARGVTDPAARRHWTHRYLTLMERESSFNPDAVNTSDSNNRGPLAPDGARLGCSRGATQMTPGAFAEAHQPGTSTNIYDPVANIAASMNRMLSHYGVSADGSDLAVKVQQTDPRRAAHAY